MRKNIDPSYWGPAGWRFLKSRAEAYVPEAKESYRMLLESLPNTLPCESCRAHTKMYMNANPVDYDNLGTWLAAFQEVVRARIHRTPPPKSKAWLVIFLILVAVLIVVIITCVLVSLTSQDFGQKY